MTSIRRITEMPGPGSDLIRELVDVFCAARKEHLQFLMDIHDKVEDRKFLSEVVLPGNQFWIAEVGNQIVGFIAFNAGWVNHLYIMPSQQRKGLGTRLLNIPKESSAALKLWVFEINAPAIQFYQSQGFRIVERTIGAANEAHMPDVLMEWNRR